jgi:glycerol uptake operon antiterminator
VIQEITEKTTTPLIAGGLIRSKQDVYQALQAGALAVSTSCQAVWNM